MAEGKDDEAPKSGRYDLLSIWLKFFQFILGSVVVAIVTLMVNHQIQEREVEIKEQEQMGKFLEHALTENLEARHRFAQYFAAVTRSDAIRVRWKEYLGEVQREMERTAAEAQKREAEIERLKVALKGPATSQAIELEEKIVKLEELKAELEPRQQTAATASRVPARVYFHIRDEDQRPRAKELAAKVTAALGVVVPGIERLDSVPDTTELRYFRTTEEAEARGIVEALTGAGLPTQLKYVPGFEGSTRVRPRHYELWIGAGAAGRG